MSKLCPNCGEELSDEAEFCPYCGETSIPKAQPAGKENMQPPLPTESGGRSVSFFDVGNFGANDVMARFCGNWMALVFAILLTLSTAFCLIDAIDMMVNDNIFDGVVTLVSVAFCTILCIGSWITFADATRHKMLPRGLSVISAGLLIAIIVNVVMYALECLSLGVLISAYVAYEGVVIIILILVIYVVIAVLTILTYIMLRRTTMSGRDFLNGESPEWKVSLFAEIMLIIIAAFTLGSTFFGDSIFEILYNVVDLALYVFAIVILFRIRRSFAR